MKHYLSALLFSGMLTFSVAAQEFQMPAASPSVKIEQDFSTSFIKLNYSRPSVKERKIFGDLIPYDEVWRTGANSTTQITFGEAVKVMGKEVKAGTYTLYTIPGEKEWIVILNTDLDNWGADGYNKRKNVVEAKIPVERLNKQQETFSFTVEDLTKNTANLTLAWADVKINIPIEADNHKRIMAHLKRELAGENPPYHRAAGYYLETGEKLEDALKYIGEAIKENPEAYYMYWTEAQIYEKLGHSKMALRSAQKSADIARKTSPAFAHEYERNLKEMSQRLNK